MVKDSRDRQRIIESIIEWRLDLKFPGVCPTELTSGPYYDKQWKDPEAPLDEIVMAARSLRHQLESNLKGYTTIELENEERELFSKASRSSTSSYQKRSEKQQFFNRPEARADFSHWARMEFWSKEEAVALILGKEPNRVSQINLEEYNTTNSPFIQEFRRLTQLIDRAVEGKRLPERPTPREFTEWARALNFEVPAKLDEELEQLELPNTPAWDTFDEGSETYPRELHIAVRAWRATHHQASDTETPKAQIRAWVKKYFPDLSKEAVERIAIVCNWNKRGGQKKEE